MGCKDHAPRCRGVAGRTRCGRTLRYSLSLEILVALITTPTHALAHGGCTPSRLGSRAAVSLRPFTGLVKQRCWLSAGGRCARGPPKKKISVVWRSGAGVFSTGKKTKPRKDIAWRRCGQGNTLKSILTRPRARPSNPVEPGEGQSTHRGAHSRRICTRSGAGCSGTRLTAASSVMRRAAPLQTAAVVRDRHVNVGRVIACSPLACVPRCRLRVVCAAARSLTFALALAPCHCSPAPC